MTIPGPTPGNLIDTVDQLVTAVNASSPVPDSSFHAIGPAVGGDNINGVQIDIIWDPDQTQITGTDLSLNGDGKTIEIGTDGIYNLYIFGTARAASAVGAEQYGVVFVNNNGVQQAGSDLANLQTGLEMAYVAVRNQNTNINVPAVFGALRMIAGDTLILNLGGSIKAGAGTLTIVGANEVLLRRIT